MRRRALPAAAAVDIPGSPSVDVGLRLPGTDRGQGSSERGRDAISVGCMNLAISKKGARGTEKSITNKANHPHPSHIK